MVNDSKNKISLDIPVSTVLKVALVVIAIILVYYLAGIIAAVFVSVVIASALDPWVDWLQKRKVPRGVSAVVFFILIAAVVGVVIYMIIPPMATQIQELGTRLPEYFQRYESDIAQVKTIFDEFNITQGVQGALLEWGGTLGGTSSGFAGIFTSTVSGIISLITVVVLSFYLIAEEQGVKKLIRSVTPSRYEPYLSYLVDRIQVKLGAWLRGQLLLMLIVGVLTYIGLSLLGVKYALVLAIIAGLLEIIPIIGVIIAIIPAVFLAFVQDPILALFVLVLYVVVQQVENHILVPRVMQKAVGLNPAIVIIMLLIGAKFGGIVGIIVSVPAAAAASVFLRDILDRRSSHESTRPKSLKV